jgi:hypothetical protein
MLALAVLALAVWNGLYGLAPLFRLYPERVLTFTG